MINSEKNIMKLVIICNMLASVLFSCSLHVFLLQFAFDRAIAVCVITAMSSQKSVKWVSVQITGSGDRSLFGPVYK